jgi:hypothetical protein
MIAAIKGDGRMQARLLILCPEAAPISFRGR